MREYCGNSACPICQHETNLQNRRLAGLTDSPKEPQFEHKEVSVSVRDCGCMARNDGGEYSKKYCLKHEPKQTLKETVVGEKWCEYWYKNQDGHWCINREPKEQVGSHIDSIKFCQVCGAEKPRPKSKTLEETLAKKLHHARHMACGMSESKAEDNWNQHTEESKRNVWGEVAKAAIQAVREHDKDAK